MVNVVRSNDKTYHVAHAFLVDHICDHVPFDDPDVIVFLWSVLRYLGGYDDKD